MSGSSLLRTAIRLMHPGVIRALGSDVLGFGGSTKSSRVCLDAAMRWMCRAQDAAQGRGVSASFSLRRGWLAPYPETTGYIIPTFLDYARVSGDDDYVARAVRMADWECEVQLDNGGVLGGVYTGPGPQPDPVAFNTGQVLLGWVRIYKDTGDQRYLDALIRAADWLVSTQSDDGAWRLPGVETETLEHAYDVRTGWSLFEVAEVVDDSRYTDAGMRNMEWTLAQENENGWYNNNAFFSTSQWTVTFTHTIAYVMEGLLGGWRHTQNSLLLDAVKRTAEKLLRIYELRKFMHGDFDGDWKSSRRYSCLTGSSQIAGVWLDLYEIEEDPRYLNAALKLNDDVKSTQSLSSWHGGIRGGIKGSQPISGTYSPYAYPNWAAKFFADALLKEASIMDVLEGATAD